jgi:class 3 adenylate cyclase
MSQIRRLAAILAADVAGNSRLMGAEEEGTHERLKALRGELIDPKIAEHHGRIPGQARGPRPPATVSWWNFQASRAHRAATGGDRSVTGAATAVIAVPG